MMKNVNFPHAFKIWTGKINEIGYGVATDWPRQALNSKVHKAYSNLINFII